MNNTKYQLVQSEATKVFKQYRNLITIDVEGIKRAIVAKDDINNIRHKYTNYEILQPTISKECFSEVAQQAIAKLKNYINSLIWREQQEYITLLVNNVEILNRENKELNSELESLKGGFQSMLKYNAEITKELRAELAKAIVSKEQYIVFIAELCDCTYDEAVNAV